MITIRARPIMRDFDNNEFPQGYLITFRCYGTWVHGDERGSYRRNYRVTSGRSRIGPNADLSQAEHRQLKYKAVRLTKACRLAVEQAVREVCSHRKFTLYAINVRTNHAHAVISANQNPEPILDDFKCYATRKLRERELLPNDVRPWARHGSTIYLWKDRDVAEAIEYVVLGQDKKFRLD